MEPLPQPLLRMLTALKLSGESHKRVNPGSEDYLVRERLAWVSELET